MESDNDISEELMTSLRQSISNNLGVHKHMIQEYIILSPLSRGSSGFVFCIRERKSKKQYALKVIWKNESKQKLHQKIKNEILIHESLKSQYIIQLLTKFEDFDNYYLVLEYCSLGDLHKYTQSKEHLTDGEIKDLGLQIAKGLNTLHDNNIIHRDLKPHNILVSNDLKAKLCDFGYSIRCNKNEKLKEIIGTINYISPEMGLKHEYNHKTDCWSYGCTLYFMATGRNPFNFQSLKELVERVKNEPVQYPQDLNSDLKDLINHLLNTDPNERYSIKDVLKHPFFNDPKTQQTQVMKPSMYRTSSSRLLPTLNECERVVKQSEYMIVPKLDKQNINSQNQSQPPELKSKHQLHKRVNNRHHKRRDQFNKQYANIMEHFQQNRPLSSRKQLQLQPLNVQRLKVPTMDTAQGKIRIDQKGFVKEGDSKSIQISISPNGMLVAIKKGNHEKTYRLEDLPAKYHPHYKYCHQVVKVIKNNLTRIKIEDEKGKFSIMWTGRMVAEISNRKIQLTSLSPIKENDDKQRVVAKKYFSKLHQILELNL